MNKGVFLCVTLDEFTIEQVTERNQQKTKATIKVSFPGGYSPGQNGQPGKKEYCRCKCTTTMQYLIDKLIALGIPQGRVPQGAPQSFLTIPYKNIYWNLWQGNNGPGVTGYCDIDGDVLWTQQPPKPQNQQNGQQGGYPNQGQGGYPQQPQGAYPPQGGYPSPQGGYPPQGSYPVQPQGAYPPQGQPQGGYPTNQGPNFPAANPPGFPAQPPQGGYPPQGQPQGGYPPQAPMGGMPAQPAAPFPPSQPFPGGPAGAPQGGYPGQPGSDPYTH